MDTRLLMEFASGESNFRILRILHDKPMYSGDIAARIQSDVRTVRTLLHRLRNKNFVEYKTVRQKHVYHIKTPFETAAHEMIMGFVAMAPPVKKPAEPDHAPLDLSEPHPLLKEAQTEYWTTLVKGFFTTMLKQGSKGHIQKVHDKLDQINNRIKRLKDM